MNNTKLIENEDGSWTVTSIIRCGVLRETILLDGSYKREIINIKSIQEAIEMCEKDITLTFLHEGPEDYEDDLEF